MPIITNVWRFQCDPQPADTDPEVQVYTKEITEVDGETFEKLSMEPVLMPLSELTQAYATNGVPAAAAAKVKSAKEARAKQLEDMKPKAAEDKPKAGAKTK